MSTAQATGDYAYVVESLLKYLRGKGQIYSAAEMACIIAVSRYIKSMYGVDLGLDKLVEDWLRMSEIEASRWVTVSQRNAEIVSKIGTQINYVQEQGTRTRILPLARRNNNKS